MTDLFERPSVNATAPSRAAIRERRAAKKRRRRRRRNSAIVVVALIAILVGGYFVVRNKDSVFGFANPVFQTKDYDGPGHGSVNVTVPQGASGAEIGQILVDAGVVQSVKAFVDAYNDNPGSGGIQPGTYALQLQMPAKDAVAALVAGQVAAGTKLTIPEGWTVDQIVERASSVTGIGAADFSAALADPASIGLPAEANGNAEGWLFPTTYVLDTDETATSVLSKMVGRTTAELDSLGVPADQRETVLIKASMIEREAKDAADRPKMARVIENRLAKGMPLQIDATVAYGLGRSGTTLTSDDLKDTSNPYNTYAINGLPPGPIASPSTDAVKAVLNPEAGDWLYWTTVNLETGETKFAATYEEHQQNVAELKQWQKDHPDFGKSDATPSDSPTG